MNKDTKNPQDINIEENFPSLIFKNGKAAFPGNCELTPLRLALIIETHIKALSLSEYSKKNPFSILGEEPFLSLLGGSTSRENFNILQETLLHIYKKTEFCEKKNTVHFRKELSKVSKYISSIEYFAQQNGSSSLKNNINTESILTGLYGLGNSDYNWNNPVNCEDSVEDLRGCAKELLEKLKKSNIDTELKTYFITSVIAIIKALEHYSILGMDKIEEVIVQTMFKYSDILKEMGESKKEEEKDIATGFRNMADKGFVLIKKATSKSLELLGAYQILRGGVDNISEITGFLQ